MRAVYIAACAAVVASASPRIASAQPEPQVSQESKDAARALAEKGYELFEAGKYADAMEHFKQAEQKFHASPHLLFIARSQVKLGNLVEGREVYEKIIAERLANYAPDAFREAQADAKKEVAALRQRIPSIQLVVIGAEPDHVKVTIDGTELPSRKLHERLPANPGPHTIVGTAEGHPPVTRSVTLAESATASIELSFGASAAPSAPPQPDQPAPDAPPTGSLVPAIAAFGVGALGLGIGAITGAISLSKVSDVKSHCEGTSCPVAWQGDADSATTLGTVSTVSFIVGGLGVGAGVVLLLVRGGGAAPPPPASWWVRPRVGLGTIGLDGRF